MEAAGAPVRWRSLGDEEALAAVAVVAEGARLPVWRPLPRHLGAPGTGPHVADPRLAGRFRWDVYGADDAATASRRASQSESGSILAEETAISRRPAMTRRLVVLLALLGLALPATATLLWPAPTPGAAPEVRRDDTARRLFESARFESLRSAWQTARSTPHTRRARTEQHDRDGLLRAFDEATTEGARTLARASGGAFDYGFFTAYVSERTTTPDPHDIGALALANLADVLRSPDAFAFDIRSDSVVGDLDVQIVEATALPGAGDGHNVRRFTLFVDPETQSVVGVDVRRIDLGTWFREETRTRVETQRLRNGRVMPTRTDFESLVVMPFRPAQPISTVALYSPLGG